MESDTRSGSSPDRKLSKILKARKGSRDPDDASVDNDSLHVDHRSSLLRASLDRGIGRLSPRSGSTDPERETSPKRRLSRLAHRSKRKKKRKGIEDGGDGQPLDHIQTDPLGVHQPAANLSAESLSHTKSAASSLMLTEDEDHEDPAPSQRPPLASRPSHTGYLTLSSPLITAETVDPTKQPQPSGSDPSATNLNSTPTPVLSIPSPETSSRADAPAQSSQDLPPWTVSAETAARDTSIDSAAEKNISGISALFGTADTTQDIPSTPPRAAVSHSRQATAATPSSRKSTLERSDTPSTLVTPPTPEQPQYASSFSGSTDSFYPSTHRRAKSASNATVYRYSLPNAPVLSPPAEEVNGSGGVAVPSSTSGGFFSSVFAATQHAVSSISNTFSTSPGTAARARSATSSTDPERAGSAGGEEVIVTNSAEALDSTPKEPAVATLGTGDLSLAHLGISEPSSDDAARDEAGDDVGRGAAIVQDTTVPNKTDEVLAADAVATAYAEKAPETATAGADQGSIAGRPRSLGSGGVASLSGDGTPPRSIANGVEDGFPKRTGSVKSKLSTGRGKKGSRAASAASGGAIAAALGASHAALANPSVRPSVPTGFAIANQKRNRDFHQLFKSVPLDDFLIDDYSAALQREIILQGRMYVSERHICFSSNIMGWVTTLIISFEEVVALEKKSTAVIFPNAIVIQTLHAKNLFISLINREKTYDLILDIWKSIHPNLKSTEHGHAIDNTVPAAVPEDEHEDSEEDSEESSDDDSSGDAEDDVAGSYVDIDPSNAVSDAGEASKVVNQRVISTAAGPGPPVNGSASKGPPIPEVASPGSVATDFPGPQAHPPTECADQATHYEKTVLDDTIPAPIGKVYTMLFGPASGVVMRKFLEQQESADISYEDDKKGMGSETKSFSYSYVKKLTGSIGPKQTKCIVNQTLDAFDLEKCVSVTCSTQTPDVPSGNVFVTKTKYCLMWAPSNATRLLVTTTVEWSGKSWIKGPVEKGAESGQAQYGKDLSAFLKSYMGKPTSKPTKGKGRGRKKKSHSHSPDASRQSEKASIASSTSKAPGWGPLEPLHGILRPVLDIVEPVFSGSSVLGILLVVVTFLWLRQSYTAPNRLAKDILSPTSPRAVSYEQMWRQEENKLWDWLEDRIKMDELLSPSGEIPRAKTPPSRSPSAESKLHEERMSERQMDDAIRVTEERLTALKAAVERKRQQGKRGQGAK